MPEYDKMTNEQLNIEVATRRGYRVEEWEFPKPTGYALIAPDGSTIVVSHTVGYAWDNLPERPADDEKVALTLWATNEVFNLEWNVYVYGRQWHAKASVYVGDAECGFAVLDASAARAVTICWLMVQDAKVEIK